MDAATLAPRFHPLTRVGLAGVGYTAAVGAAFAAWHRAVGTEPAWLALAISLAPALLAAAFALSSPHDRRQYAARVVAVVLMAPILQLFWSLEEPRAGLGMALAIGGVLLHAGAFLLAVRWLAAETTAIDAAPSAGAVSSAALALRLASLRTLGLGLRVDDRAAPAIVQIAWQRSGEAERCHRVELRLDEATQVVTVIERLQADGAAPADADEASMRSLGDPMVDPTRPDAQRVWLRTMQTTMLDARRLDDAPVALDGDRAVWAGAGAPALPDTDTLMAVLAAIVVRSGWAWRPRLS